MLSESLLHAYQALVGEGAALHLPGRTLIEVTGPDRAAFLNSFCTNDIKKLSAGQGCEAFVTSHQGKTLGHVLLFGSDVHVIETVPGQSAALIGHFEKFVISERIEFRDRTGDWSELLVTSDRGADLIRSLMGIAAPATLYDHVAAADMTVRRVPFSTAPCWLLQHAAADAPKVAAALQGHSMPVFDQPELLEILRIEVGWPSFGSDITPDNLPKEIGRDAQAISFKKGCYLGQETVARLDALGHVNRVLVGVQIEAALPPDVGTPLLLDGKEVGKLTSVVWSPKLQSPLAMAVVRRSAVVAKATLLCDGKAAKVVQLPLV